MLITLTAQHQPQVPLLRGLLGDGFEVQGLDRLPAEGPIRSDVLLCNRLTAAEAERLQVRLLQAPGAGLDAMALDAVPADCTVCNVYEHEIPIAEFVCRAVLDHVMFSEHPPAPVDAAHWPAAFAGRPFHGEANGRHAAIVGFGAIGQATAQRLKALGLHITAVTRRPGVPEGADAQHPVTALAALLPQVDVLVLCCPLDDSTRGLIGAPELAAMKPDALLINVGRAPLVQPAPLYQALQQRRIGRAVLDVWYHYPTAGQTTLAPADFPFHELPNAVCTPHISGWTHGLLQRRYAVMADNIRRLARGEPLRHVVRAAA